MRHLFCLYGLQGDIVRAIGGDSLCVNPDKFQNSVEESSHPELARVMSDSIRLASDVLAQAP